MALPAPRSTALPAKKLILEKLEALAESPTLVWRNHPNEEYPLGENIFVGDIARGHREFATIGRGSQSQRDESYTIGVEVAVARRGRDSEGTEDRAWELAEVVEEAIEKDVGLSNLQGIVSVVIQSFEGLSKGGTDGWLCVVSMDVLIEARLRPE